MVQAFNSSGEAKINRRFKFFNYSPCYALFSADKNYQGNKSNDLIKIMRVLVFISDVPEKDYPGKSGYHRQGSWAFCLR